MLYFSMF